jgi:predicted transcriptional regulator
MDAPCQKIVWDVLPAIRAAIAVELVRNGVSQVETARMLEIAPSAVSQYISGKRGYRVEFEEDVKKSVSILAQDLIDKKQVNLIERICGICQQLRNNEGGCTVSASLRCGS